jgi:hypothetical protein
MPALQQRGQAKALQDSITCPAGSHVDVMSLVVAQKGLNTAQLVVLCSQQATFVLTLLTCMETATWNLCNLQHDLLSFACTSSRPLA